MHLNQYLRLCIAAIACFLSVNNWAQEMPNEKVANQFSQTELAAMSNEDIDRLNFISEQSFMVSHMPEKAAGLPDLMERDPGVSPENINPFALGIEAEEEHQRFRIGDTGYVVLFYSEQRVDKLYGRSKLNPTTLK